MLMKGDLVYGFEFRSSPPQPGPGFVSHAIVQAASLNIIRSTSHRHGFMWHKKTITVTNHVYNFKWIPFVNGKINYCFAQGQNVLSGWYSGCWMSTYTEAGARRVAHITFQGAADPMDCRVPWAQKKAQGNVDAVSEFDAHASLSKGAWRVGLVTSTSALYAIGLDMHEVKLDNPWTEAADWKREHPHLPDHLCDEFSALGQVSTEDLKMGFGYKVAQVNGPLRPQTFPA